MTRRKLYQLIYVGPYDQEVDRSFEQRLWASARIARGYGLSHMPLKYHRHWVKAEKKHVNSYALNSLLVEATSYPRVLVKHLLTQLRCGETYRRWLRHGLTMAAVTLLVTASLRFMHAGPVSDTALFLGVTLALLLALTAVGSLLRTSRWHARLEAAQEFWQIEADVLAARRLEGVTPHMYPR